MIVLGFILLVVCAVVIAAAVYGGQADARLDVGIFAFNVDLSAIFFTGVATALVGVIGLGLMKRGLRVSRERRKELKQLEKMRGELDRRGPEVDRDVKPVEKSPNGNGTV